MADSFHDLTIDDRLEIAQERLGYRFDDLELLRRCLTHTSAASIRADSNERLEFFGDAILGVVVCEELYHRFPESEEGELTRIKSAVVSRTTCARVAEELDLEDCLILGKGLSGARRLPPSIQAGVVEALVAGVYLDGGMDAVAAFIERTFTHHIEQASELNRTGNFKSQLQQVSQKTYGETPEYPVLDIKGPDHSKCFKVAARIGHHMFQSAWGPTKKEAEQRAACNALYEIEGLEPRYVAD
jgi:ribonuclease III